MALSFALTAVGYTAIGVALGDIDPIALRALPSRWFGLIQDQNLLAIPSAAAGIAFANRRLSWAVIRDAARSTAGIAGLVMMMLFASNYFADVFDLFGGQDLVADWLTHLPGGYWSFVVVANVVVFLLGLNLEFLEISFIVMPILTPIASELGVDLVWFVVMIAVNLNIAIISPPVGFSLFYLQSVKPDRVRTSDIHRGALPFVWIQVVALVVVMLCSPLVTWLAY